MHSPVARSPNVGRCREKERKKEWERQTCAWVSAWVLENGGGCGVEGGTDWGGMNVLREGVSVARRCIPLFTCVKTDRLMQGTQLLDLLGFFPVYFKLHYGQKTTTYNTTLESEITKALGCCRKGFMRSFHPGLQVCLLLQ